MLHIGVNASGMKTMLPYYKAFNLKFIFLVFWAFMERSVIAELPDVVNSIKALYAIRDTVHLQHINIIWNGSHCIDLQICNTVQSKKKTNEHIGTKQDHPGKSHL